MDELVEAGALFVWDGNNRRTINNIEGNTIYTVDGIYDIFCIIWLDEHGRKWSTSTDPNKKRSFMVDADE